MVDRKVYQSFIRGSPNIYQLICLWTMKHTWRSAETFHFLSSNYSTKKDGHLKMRRKMFFFMFQIFLIPYTYFIFSLQRSYLIVDASVSLHHQQLHYDHQGLLDYLFSKDAGISCAEYLLRCLRLVCDSWKKFTEFSMYWEVKNQSSSKRRNFLSESSNRTIELSSGPTKTIPLYLEKKVKGDLEYRCVEQAYEQAKDCLLSLKKSVENLHLKNLFPYNPEVLLKRLTRFEELCFKQ